ncbi:FAD-dependent oxidoreductase [Malaciobacter molluscorum LMG 25693]|uniref:FAD-dependent oxidoreductase n=1 Tax=Malaciobacter molluscorum LMG 25693 TaxID=870501 RepID=A0A2G1DJH0_9BACT|nr:NAD(P)-binding protein [Malaciobacter molluscorum]AXX91615.1 NAD/FAD-binding protein [Malaciobacter molluscorum LMG 25693]PHO18590.1 FAD-dependent oxidoreductase [Malaciobacter molluscorum LMG 25693]RXJ94579.1 FAD-dependent oxidoreductase [Malaciobacter molluscorum]
MKIAVIGAGISGLASAYLLSKKYEVDLYEKQSRLGGHARTTILSENNNSFGVDTGFLVFNYETYPLLTKLFELLDVKIENSNMSFGFWDKMTDIAYNAESLKGLFIQKRNLFSFSHYQMIFDILKFNKKANKDLETNHKDLNKTLGEYISIFSDAFKQRYILPMGAAIWSTPDTKMNDFPAKTFLQFFKNHGLLGINTHHQWLTVSNGSVNYVNKISKKISGKIILNSDIIKVERINNKIILENSKNEKLIYDKVIFACHAPQTLELLADASQDEIEILSCFKYKTNRAVLHNDKNALYKDKNIYAAWNYTNNKDRTSVSLSYWINRLQNLKSNKDYFVTLNEDYEFKEYIEKISYEHPQFDRKAIEAQEKRDLINGKNNTYFAGAYWRYGFHEDGLYSANTIAKEFGCEL